MSSGASLTPAAVLERIRGRPPAIAPPVAPASNHAAVAVVLAPGSGRLARTAEILFIVRARVEGDHWSGQVAFPGGRREPEDRDIEATARRETQEETGVRLPAEALRLDDFDARTSARRWELVVSPFVYALGERPPLALNHEVQEAYWIPLEALLDPRNAARHRLPVAPGEGAAQDFPAIRLGEHLLWGMTYRMLDGFLARLGLKLPAAPRRHGGP